MSILLLLSAIVVANALINGDGDRMVDGDGNYMVFE
jgi:hypothetical protein